MQLNRAPINYHDTELIVLDLEMGYRYHAMTL